MTIFLLSTSSSSCSTLAFMVDSNNARLYPATTLQMSSIGGGSEDNPNSSNNGDSDDDDCDKGDERGDTVEEFDPILNRNKIIFVFSIL